MSDAAVAGQRAALSAERERVTNELEVIGIDSGTNDSGFADSGQVTAERGEIDALVGSLRDTLSDINDALAKIDAGTYGVCEQCSEAIGDARLEAMPAARLCMSCASARR
jgi:DnaK suppressor protein